MTRKFLTIFLLIALITTINISAQDSASDSAGILIPDPPITNPEGQPRSPMETQIHYEILQNILTLYTANSAMANIKLTDAATGTLIHDAYSDLSNGFSVPLPSNVTVFIQVIVDGVIYSCIL